ncbi:MAG: PspA/IM30 family protein [Armatimonadota bacterium]|nr:PspA/IM30 family protein [Armatimonadota bacterium]
MWARIKAIFRSLFGWLLRGMEHPEMLLRQYMDDMRSQIPRLNAQVAEVIKHEKLLEMEAERKRQTVAELEPRVEAAVKMGPEKKEAAKRLIVSLETAKGELAELEEQLERARQNSQNMMRQRTAYEQRIKRQIDEAKRQLSRAKRAEVEKQIASTMASFEVGDASDTLERVTERIDEELARSKARQEVASDTLESQMAELELDVADQQAELAYVEYQRQLGLIPDEEAERTMESVAQEGEGEHVTGPPSHEEMEEIEREMQAEQTEEAEQEQ